MKKIISMCALAAFALGIVGASVVSAKNHVKIDKIQVCTDKGKVKEVGVGKLQKQLDGKGSCLLPSCDGNVNHIFLKGDSCDNIDQNDDGFCDLAGERISANAFDGTGTPACYSGNY